MKVYEPKNYVDRFRWLSHLNAFLVLGISVFILLFRLLYTNSVSTATFIHEGLNEIYIFILIGGALTLMLNRQKHQVFQYIAYLLIVVIMICSILELTNYFTGWNVGLGGFFRVNQSNQSITVMPGRVSPSNALNFFLISFALFTMVSNKWKFIWTMNILVLIIFGNTLVAMIGYLYHTNIFVRDTFYAGECFVCTLLSLMVAMSILFSKPDKGLTAILSSPYVGGMISRLWIPLLIIIPILHGWVILMGQRQELYSSSLGLTLIKVSNIILFIMLVLVSGKLLNDKDERRQQMEIERANMLKREKNARKYAEKVNSQIRFIAEAGKILSSSLQYEKTLETVADLAVSRISDWCTIDLMDANKQLQRIVISHANPQKVELAKELKINLPPREEYETGIYEVINSGEPRIFREITDEIIRRNTLNERQFKLMKSLKLQSAMILPLIARNKVFGAMTLVSAESDHKYTTDDLIFARNLAERAAQAIDNSQLYREAQELNEELRRTNEKLKNQIEERQRLEKELLQISESERWSIGQNLHDELGQMLTGTRLISTDLANKLGKRDPELKEEAEEIVDLIQEADNYVRDLTQGVIPVELDSEGLTNALEKLAGQTSQRDKLECTFKESGTVKIANNTIATNLYRIAQEAIRNAVKHAQATSIQIKLYQNMNGTRLIIQDNGIGFNGKLDEIESPGMGIRIMHYRAHVIGGNLEIEKLSDGQQGTRVSCIIPPDQYGNKDGFQTA